MGKQMTLGDLIDALEPIKDKIGCVNFAFGQAIPTTIYSYRGYYDRLAISFSGDRGVNKDPYTFYQELVACVGATFRGWKGGEYTMTRDTLVHVACPGNTSDTVIVDVEISDHDKNVCFVQLITEEQED